MVCRLGTRLVNNQAYCDVQTGDESKLTTRPIVVCRLGTSLVNNQAYCGVQTGDEASQQPGLL